MTSLNHDTAALSLGAIRAIRARTRLRFHEPRPPTTPEIRQRVGAWKARLEAAQKAGLISKGCHLYATNLLSVSSVARGQWCLYSDESMGERVNCSGRTVRRHRKELVDANLVESLDGRRRHQTCMVRPILDDGAVYVLPKKPDDPTNNGRPVRPAVADELRPTRTYSKPPLSPEHVVPSNECGRPLVAADVVADGPPLPPSPPIGQGLAEATVSPAVPITFGEFWSATDRAGAESAAAAAFKRLSDADRAAIAAAIARQGRLRTGTSLVANWLKYRLWPTLAVPITAAEVGLFRVEADSAAGHAWRRHWSSRGMRALPVGRDGYFIKPLPSLWPPKQ